MTKKENTGGRKYQSRQPGEKRVRSAKPESGKPDNSGSNKRYSGQDRNSSFGNSGYKRREDSGQESFRPKKTGRPSFRAKTGNETEGPKTRNSRGTNPYSKPEGGYNKPGTGRSYGSKFKDGENKPKFGGPRNTGKPEGRYTGPRKTNRFDDREGTGRKRSEGFGDRRSAPGGEEREGTSRKRSQGFGDRRNSTGGEGRAGSSRKRSEGFGDRRNATGGEGRVGSSRKRSEGFGDRRNAPKGEGREFKSRTGAGSYGAKRGNSGFGDKTKQDTRSKPDFGKTQNRRSFHELAEEQKDRRGRNPRGNSNYKGRGKAYDKAAKDLNTGKELNEGEVRLNRYIANSGLGSRREADVYIQEGLVSINGVTVTELGTKVKPGDTVKVDGRKITAEKPVYIIMNKPKGYITTTDDPDGRKTVMDLIDMPGRERIYPVGRLDRNTTGVLLLTNDGELSQKLMHPSFEIRKIYKVTLDRKPNKEHMLAWVNGVELEDGFQDFEQCGFVDDSEDTVLGVEIHSGRNRIVRRMFEHFNYEVVALDRVMLGDFDHTKLGRGKWRLLNDKEIAYVERLKRMKPKK